MSNTTRSDGLNNPMSINSGIGCTWDRVEEMCEESDAVTSYNRPTPGSIWILWCDGNESTHSDPQGAMIEIREMSVH